MFGNIITYLVIKLLNYPQLSSENRLKLTSRLLDRLSYIPSEDIIATDELGKLTINGKPLTMESAIVLKASAKAVLDSKAWKIVNEQVTFLAVSHGVHKGDSTEKLLWSRIAIWWGQQQEKLFKALAQEE